MDFDSFAVIAGERFPALRTYDMGGKALIKVFHDGFFHLPSAHPLPRDTMQIIDANKHRTAFIPTDTVYTEDAVKIIIEHVVQAAENGKTAEYIRQKKVSDWL